jgi:peptide/nickel transport system ATP-binding protein
MRQRIMIAMALACSPKVLIADEPTTALDVTVQAQIFSLLRDLQARTSTAIVLITHDMGVVAEMADDIIVMYAGRLAERGSVEAVLSRPAHPYTRGLIDCVPHLQLGSNISHKPVTEIPGVVPALQTIGAGCPFASRCGLSEERCEAAMPELSEVRPSHQVACWNSQEA